MKVAYLTRIKDEEDLIYYNLKYYYNLGVDGFFVTFNNSNKETIDLVEQFVKDHPDKEYHYFIDQSTSYNQSEMFDEMSNFAYNQGYKWQLPVDADEILFIKSGVKIKKFLKQYVCHEYGHLNLQWFDYHPSKEDDINDKNFFTRWKYRAAKNRGYTKIIYKWSPLNKHGFGHHAIIANNNLICQVDPGIMFMAHFPCRSKKQVRKKAIRIGEAFIERFGYHFNCHQIRTYKKWEEFGDSFFDELWKKKEELREKAKMIYDPLDENMFK